MIQGYDCIFLPLCTPFVYPFAPNRYSDTHHIWMPLCTVTDNAQIVSAPTKLHLIRYVPNFVAKGARANTMGRSAQSAKP